MTSIKELSFICIILFSSCTINNDPNKELLEDEVQYKNKIEFVNNLVSSYPNIDNFILFSDIHCFSPYNESHIDNDGLEILKTIKKTSDKTKPNFTFFLGDALSNHKYSTAIKDLKIFKEEMDKYFDNYYFALGNHDNNSQGELDSTSDRDANDGSIDNEVLHDIWFNNFEHMYYSFESKNSTLFAFDSGAEWKSNMTEYRVSQTKWFANKLLANDKENILIFIHIMWKSLSESEIAEPGNTLTYIANQFNNRKQAEVDGINYDFKETTGKVKCVFCGHIHQDHIGLINEIPVISISNANNEKHAVFDYVIIDHEQDSLHCIRFGAGDDVHISLMEKNTN